MWAKRPLDAPFVRADDDEVVVVQVHRSLKYSSITGAA